MTSRPASVDAYLNALPADQRQALQALRDQIRAAAPDCEEVISYAMPGFRLPGGVLVWIGAGKAHCALYPTSTVKDFADELAGYRTSKGAIQFHPERPLPPDLVRRIVEARVLAVTARKKR